MQIISSAQLIRHRTLRAQKLFFLNAIRMLQWSSFILVRAVVSCSMKACSIIRWGALNPTFSLKGWDHSPSGGYVLAWNPIGSRENAPAHCLEKNFIFHRAVLSAELSGCPFLNFHFLPPIFPVKNLSDVTTTSSSCGGITILQVLRLLAV